MKLVCLSVVMQVNDLCYFSQTQSLEKGSCSTLEVEVKGKVVYSQVIATVASFVSSWVAFHLSCLSDPTSQLSEKMALLMDQSRSVLPLLENLESGGKNDTHAPLTSPNHVPNAFWVFFKMVKQPPFGRPWGRGWDFSIYNRRNSSFRPARTSKSMESDLRLTLLQISEQ